MIFNTIFNETGRTSHQIRNVPVTYYITIESRTYSMDVAVSFVCRGVFCCCLLLLLLFFREGGGAIAITGLRSAWSSGRSEGGGGGGLGGNSYCRLALTM